MILGRLRRRPTLAAGLLYTALAILLLLPGLLPGRTISTADSLRFAPPWAASRPVHLTRISNDELGDAVVQFQLFIAFARDAQPHAPLWNPYLMSGRPLLADDQSAVLSPFSVPAYILPLLTSLGWSAVLKLVAAALGVFVLARALGQRFAAALLAGLVYGFSFWMVSWLAYPHSGVWALFGWLLWAIEGALVAPGPRRAAALALAIGLQFLAGHAESSFDMLVGAAVFLGLRATQHGCGGSLRWRPALATLGFGAVVGTGMAAALLAPFGQLLLGSADLHQRAGSAIDQHLPLRGLLGAFLPAYWGRATQTPLIAFIRAQAYYAGALPLLLAAVALIRRPRLERIGLAALGFTGIAVAVGVPPLLQIVTRLPGFSAGHNSRLIPWTLVALALLAGWGLDDLRSPAPPARTRAALTAAAAVLAAPVIWVLARGEINHVSGRSAVLATGLSREPAAGVAGTASTIHLAALLAWLGFAGAAWILIWLRGRGRLPGAVFAALALGLTVLDLAHAGMGYNPAVARADARPPTTGAIRYLQAHRGPRFQSTEPVPWNVVAMEFHLPEAGGYDLPIPSRYDRLWRTQVDPEHPSQVGHTFADIPLILPAVDARRLHTLRMLGVGLLLTPPGGPVLRVSGVRSAYAGADARVYAVAGAQPRAALVSGVQPVSSADAALGAVSDPAFDARQSVVVEGRAAPRAAGSAGVAHVAADSPQRVQIATDGVRASTLVLDDAFATGWSATLDGRPAAVRQVDYVLQGVAVPAGHHTVVFAYRPASWTVGWITSVMSLLAIAAAFGLGTGRWRR